MLQPLYCNHKALTHRSDLVYVHGLRDGEVLDSNVANLLEVNVAELLHIDASHICVLNLTFEEQHKKSVLGESKAIAKRRIYKTRVFGDSNLQHGATVS